MRSEEDFFNKECQLPSDAEAEAAEQAEPPLPLPGARCEALRLPLSLGAEVFGKESH